MNKKFEEKDSINVKSCCICDAVDLSLILDMGETPLANNLSTSLKKSSKQKEYNLGLLICKN